MKKLILPLFLLLPACAALTDAVSGGGDAASAITPEQVGQTAGDVAEVLSGGNALIGGAVGAVATAIAAIFLKKRKDAKQPVAG